MSNIDISADKTIEVIQHIRDSLGPEHAAFLAFPNVVLTLAGARTSGDAVFYHTDEKVLKEWNSQIATLGKELASIEPILFNSEISENPRGESFVDYNFKLKRGFENTIYQYSFLDKAFEKNISSIKFSKEIFKKLDDYIQSSSRLDEFTKDQRSHIYSGVMLGYPEKAILKSVPRFFSEDPFELPLIPAAIRGASYYVCPQPVYDYPRELFGDSEIKTHEETWSSVLVDYYTSDFHKLLEQNESFREKIKLLQY